MERIVSKIDRINLSIGSAVSWIGVPLTFVVLIEVGLRYIFNNPTIWAYDSAWMLYSVFFLLGGGYTMARKRHVRIDLLYGLLPKKAQIIHELIFFFIFFLPVTVTLTFISSTYALKAWETGQSIDSAIWVFPVAPVRTVIPIAFFLLTLQGIAEILRNILYLTNPSELEAPSE